MQVVANPKLVPVIGKLNMNVLVFLHHYLPGYKAGGPLRTVANMVTKLPQIAFSIVTTDRDLGDREAYGSVVGNRWTEMAGARLFYAPAKQGLFKRLRSVLNLMKDTPHDVLYLNSYFNVRFTLLPLLARKLLARPMVTVVLAPRGEFSAGALALKSWKKKPYIFFMRMLRMHEGVVWQASSEYEAADISRIIRPTGMGNVMTAENIFIAPDLSAAPPSTLVRGNNLCFKVIFLSRISPKKNLKFALGCLSKIERPVEFSIYGPVEDRNYWAECEQIIAALPSNIVVRIMGPVPPSSVPLVLREHDLFFFPTLGENFGHVIIEALAAGTPVLISDQTPWRSDAVGACTALPLDDPAVFVRALNGYIGSDQESRNAMSAAATLLSTKFSDDDVAIEKNIKLFQQAISRNRGFVQDNLPI